MKQRLLLLTLLFALVAVAGTHINSQSVRAASSPLVVNSTGDDIDDNPGDGICDTGSTVGGDPECTLRAAIQESNADPDADVINFNITGTADFVNEGQNGYVIAPLDGFPTITQELIINAYTQPGSQPNTNAYPAALNTRILIELNGENNSDSAFIPNADTVIRGFSFTNWHHSVGSGAINVGSGVAVITGNYIGTKADGVTAESNAQALSTGNSAYVQLGGPLAADRNLISGNDNGASLSSASVVQGNFIGTDKTGTQDLGNINFGLFLFQNIGMMIGGTGLTDGNVIAYNKAGGIMLSNGSIFGTTESNAILGNSIYSNGIGIGIDLTQTTQYFPDIDMGTNTNDPGDTDDGPNTYINHPVITAANFSGNAATIKYDLDVAGSPSNNYRVEFFGNDTNAEGEGRTYLGFENTSAGLGKTSTSLTAPSGYDLAGKFITATVTQLDGSFPNGGFGSTSEFSLPIAFALGSSEEQGGVLTVSATQALASTGSNVVIVVFSAFGLVGFSTIALRKRFLASR